MNRSEQSPELFMEVADDDGGRRKDGDVVGQVPAGFVTGVGKGSMEIEARTEKEF